MSINLMAETLKGEIISKLKLNIILVTLYAWYMLLSTEYQYVTFSRLNKVYNKA